MTPAEICTLSQTSLDKVRALKQEFDAAFEILAISGSKKDLHKGEKLQQQLSQELQQPLIAHGPEEISDKTLIYIGKLEPGMFKSFPRSIERIYTSFPERELLLESLRIGDKTSDELQELMRKNRIAITEESDYIMDSSEFEVSQAEQVDVIKLHVGDLGLSARPTTNEIYIRIAELGLELCPPAVGPHYRLAHLNQPMRELVFVGMRQITVQDGSLNIFCVEHSSGGVSLCTGLVKPDGTWHPDDQFLFRVRKSDA